MHALVVDDSRAMRMLLRRNLERLGFEVHEAGNGREALDLLDGLTEVPDVALVDWNMPVMDGLELVKAIHAQPRWRAMTVMMVTSESEPSRVVQALTAGAHEYLKKPLQEQAIFDKLSVHGLGQHGLVEREVTA